jgi:hypothetical protein
MNGSLSLDAVVNVPHRMPSGTPISDESKKPRNITCRLCNRLSCSHGSVGRRGGVRKATISARATSCGAGRYTGLAGSPRAGARRSASAFWFSASKVSRSSKVPGCR